LIASAVTDTHSLYKPCTTSTSYAPSDPMVTVNILTVEQLLQLRKESSRRVKHVTVIALHPLIGSL